MNSDTRVEEWRHTRRIISYGFVALLLLVGIAIATGIVFRILYPPAATAPYPFWRFGFGFGFIWAIFGLFFLFWILRWVFWPWRPYRYGYYYRHWGWGPGGDDAVSILRSRYARGEITKEQFDQMMQDLRQHTSP